MTQRECEICRALPDKIRVHGSWTGGTSGEFPPEYERLEVVAGNGLFVRVRLMRCPLCDTYYHYEYDKDYDSWDKALRRISTVEALDRLRNFHGPHMQAALSSKQERTERQAAAAEQTRLKDRYDAEVAALVAGLGSSAEATRSGAASDLAQHHGWCLAWRELEALLGQDDFAVREGAADGLGSFLRYERPWVQPPEYIVQALVKAHVRVDPGQSGQAPIKVNWALKFVAARSKAFPRALPVLARQLDDGDEAQRTLAMELLLHYFVDYDMSQRKYVLQSWVSDHGPQSLAVIPVLVRHVVAPRSVGRAFQMATSAETTGQGALRILAALVDASQAASRAVHDEIVRQETPEGPDVAQLLQRI